MEKVKIGDRYLMPAGTKLWFIDLQQSFITTKKYVIEVTNTIANDDVSFFGDLYEVVFEYQIPGLLKVHHGETMGKLDMVEPLGDLLKSKICYM